jgi:hypothetical protein
MKDTEDVDVSVDFYEVGDSVMPVKQDSDISRRCDISVSDFRERG